MRTLTGLVQPEGEYPAMRALVDWDEALAGRFGRMTAERNRLAGTAHLRGTLNAVARKSVCKKDAPGGVPRA
jgi:hypothetical protein